MEVDKYSYDVALSFAGEDRNYVEEVAVLLKSLGVKVFYDKFEETNLWGKNLFEYLNSVYRDKAKYTVMFISEHYQKKLWTNHERKSMQERAFKESSEYILPVRFDDTEIPGLHSTISYLDLGSKTPEMLTRIICDKIGWVTKNRWWGKWKVETEVMAYDATLQILNVNREYFEFSLSVVHGAHSGSLEGNAFFNGNNEALFRQQIGDEGEVCKVRFFKTNDVIQVDEDRECNYFHGMRAHFMGDYKLKKDVFYKFDFINDEVLTKAYSILKDEFWYDFLECFSDLMYDENIENNDLKIIEGGVAGLYTICEGILMVGKSNAIWGAFLDVDKVYYFSSEDYPGDTLPKPLEEWKEKFQDKEIVHIKKSK